MNKNAAITTSSRKLSFLRKICLFISRRHADKSAILEPTVNSLLMLLYRTRKLSYLKYCIAAEVFLGEFRDASTLLRSLPVPNKQSNVFSHLFSKL